VPFDGLPPDIGVLCQNVGTAAAIARWITEGEPLIRRIVTVTGDGVMDAGISRYTYQLLDGLGRIESDIEFSAFINGAERKDADMPDVRAGTGDGQNHLRPPGRHHTRPITPNFFPLPVFTTAT